VILLGLKEQWALGTDREIESHGREHQNQSGHHSGRGKIRSHLESEEFLFLPPLELD
jgi:hypothetical protein